ncbi:MAG: hypothetical protein WA085_13365 [Sphingobium sp.]
MKVKARSEGAPSPALAGAFVRLLVAAVEKRPELKVVPKVEKVKAA